MIRLDDGTRFIELFFCKKKYLLVGAWVCYGRVDQWFSGSLVQWISGSVRDVCHTNQIGSTIKKQSNFLL